MRGLGGTEHAVSTHHVGESFVLLDAAPIALNASIMPSSDTSRIAAIGLGDATPIFSSITNYGIAKRPLSPVHPRYQVRLDGSLTLQWTRRSRGSWHWNDFVDTPLHEAKELYRISFGPTQAPIISWEISEPSFTLPAQTWNALQSAHPNAHFNIHQEGEHTLSLALTFPQIPY